MKLHLPVRLFRAIIALMVATPFSAFAVYTAPTVITIPDAFINNQVEVDATDDISQYCKKDEDVAFLLSGDIVFDSLTSQFMTSSAGSWFVTSKSEDALASITFSNSTTTTSAPSFFSVSSDESLTFAYLDTVLFDTITITSNSNGSAVVSGKNITFRDNKSVQFSGNKGASYGGNVISSSGGLLAFQNNAEVIFDSNKPYRASSVIYTSSDTIFTGNDLVKITNNTGYYSGGIYVGAATLTISENTDVLFQDNEAIWDGYSGGEGGAIKLSSSEAALAIEYNTGKVQFVSNEAFSGGAIWANEGTTVNLHSNEYLEFSSNVANKKSGGGAIYSKAGTKITGNEKVVFSGNVSTTTESAGTPLYGGAILSQGLVHIQNNTDVLFDENNVKSSHSSLDNLNINGGAIGITNSSSIILEDNTKIVFSNNYVGTEAIPGVSSGGALYTGGEIVIKSNGEVEFNNNRTYSEAYSYFDNSGSVWGHKWVDHFYGGAIKANGVTINANKYKVSFNGNHIIGFNGTGNYGGEAAYTYGGAIYASIINVKENKSEVSFNNNYSQAVIANGGALCGTDISFSDNSDVVFEGNYAKGFGELAGGYEYRQAFGGAVKATNVSFIGNGDVDFLNNSAITIPYKSGSEYGKKSLGGAIYAANITIQNNGNVTFKGNNTLYNTTQTSDSVYQHDATGKLILSSRQGKTIAFYDAFYAAGEVLLNSKCEELAQTGDIRLITQTATTGGMTHLYDGRLRIEYEGDYSGKGMVIHSSVSGESAPTVWLKHGKLTHSDSNIQFQVGSCLELSGMNKITASSLEMQQGSALTFHVVADQMGVSNLTLNGTFAQEGALTLNISFNDTEAEAGLYKLMTVTSIADDTIWTSSNVTVNGLDGYVVSFDDLEWKDNTLYLNYNGTPGTGGATTPTLLIATWTNEEGDGLWNGTSLNWEQEEVDYAYKDGVQVVFGDEGAGTVTLVGDIAPSSVLVDSKEDYIWNADSTAGGKLTGSMSLTKKGTGTLSINTENDYTGGTTIQGGTVVAGTATALGSGAVSLTDATLKIAAEGVENALTTAGTSSILVQDVGSLALQSAITNAATGILTLSGKVDVSGIGELTKLDATLIDVNGNAGTSGFARTEGYTLQVVQGGKVLASDAQLEHSGLPTGLTLVLGENGLATAGATTDFTKYVVTGSHAVSVSEILKDVPQDSALSSIEMSGGTLLVDAATDALAATGGTVTVNKAVTLGGTMSGGILMAQAGEIAATLSGSTSVVTIGTVTLSGANSHSGGVMLNGGALTLKHAQALGSGQLVTSGTSSLVIDSGVELALGQAISNSGSLSVSGKIHATGALNTEAATCVDVNGNSGASGFAKDALEWVQIVNGGTTVNAGAEISHNSATNALVLGSDGRAIGGGVIHHDEYLLTGTGVADVQGIKDAAGSELTSIKMQGGTLTVNADTGALLSAEDGIILLKDGGTIGSGSSVSGVDIKASGGSIAAILTGSNTLEGIGDFALNAVIANNGTLVLSGNIKADALSLVEETPSTFVDVNGNSGTSGFSKSALVSVQLTSGTGTTIDGCVTLTHKDATETLVLGKDGKAGYGGVINYTNYLLDGEYDCASVSDIIADAGDALTSITVQQGTLTVDAVSKPITATGGAVVLDGGVLNGTLADTDLTLKNGSLDAASITGGSVSGENYLMGAVLNVSGDVAVSGSFNASALQLNTTNATRIDVNGASGASGFYQADAYSVQVFNGGTLDIASGTTVKHGGIDLLLGSNGYATAGGGITWSEYLLTGEDSATASVIYQKAIDNGYNGAVSITQTGGTLTVTADAEVTTTAGSINLTGGTLSGTISGATLSVTGGKLSATLSGTNTLSGANKLINVLDNDGMLNISGTLDVTQLGDLTDHGVTYTKGGSNGFKTSSAYSIKFVDNSGSLNSTATIKHGEIDNFVLGSDGVARAEGTTFYDTYYITSGHEAAVDDIRGESGNKLTLIDMSGGTLNANADAAVKVTGGAINLTAGELSGSISGATLGVSGGTLAATLSGNNTLSGANKLYNVLDNDGMLNISGTLDVTQLGALTDHGVTYTKGGSNGFKTSSAYSIKLVDNSGSLNSTATIKHGEIDNFVLGSDGVATAAGTTDYKTYFITSGHEATVDAIRGESGNKLTLIDMSGGTLNANADAAVKVMGGEVKLTAGELSGSISGATLGITGGSLTAALSGTNTLSGANKLFNVLDNDGVLNISGTLDVTQLGALTDHGVTYTKGGSNGFKTSSAYSIKLVDNSGSLNSAAIIQHGEIDNFVLDSDGVARAEGTTFYDTYYITSGHEATVDAIRGESGNQLTLIDMSGGSLDANADAAVKVTGGAINLTAGELSGSISGATLSVTGGKLTATLSGTNTLSGANKLLNVLDNDGLLNISGSLDVTQLGDLTDHGVTYTKGGSNGFKTSSAYSIKLVENTGTLNSTATIKHGEIDNFVLGLDGVATAAGITDYKTYFITAGHEATVDAIRGESGNKLTLIDMSGGTLNANADAAVKVTGGAINLMAGELSGSISGAALSITGGSLTAALSGINTLSGINKLFNLLDNDGALNISGALDVTQLGNLTDHGVTYTKGGSNGFKTSSAYSIKLVDNSGTINSTATIKHGEIDNFVLGSDGVARAEGTTFYDTYYITSGHEATVDAIRGESGNQLTLIDMSGGTLNANADAAVKVTGGAINLTAGTLSGSISGATLSVSGGTLAATLSGNNTLSGANKLYNVLDNDGLLNISGSLDVTQLGDLTDHGVTYTKGGSNGFKTSSAYSIKLVDNSGSLNSTATIKHGEIDNFVLGSDGVATAAGTTDYKTYYITFGHAAAVDAIRGESGNQLTLIDMSGGSLDANADATVKVMGGEVKLTAGTLTGTISGATLSVTGGKLTATLSGTNTLSGANKLLNVLDNDGLLNISGSLDVTQLGDLTDHGVTYTKGGSNGFKTSSAYSIKLVDNSGSLNSTATIKHGEIDNFVLGSDGVATAAGTTDYKTYFITAGHEATVDAIRGESGNQLTLVDMSGGTLNANADAAVKVTGGAINLTAGTLSGSISGATLGITGGSLTAALSGTNTLSGVNKLSNVLDNDGVLNISGSLDVTQLGDLTDHGVTYTEGGSNGFKTSSAYSIKFVDNSGSLNSTATIKHGEIDNFVLGSDGVARAEGTTFYDTYYITSGHEATVDAIRGESGNQLTLIDMSGGTLNANADAAVKVTGGAINLTAGTLSGSISGATLSVSGGTLAATLSGNNTLVGDDYVLNSKLSNSGTLTLSGSFSIGSGLTVKHTDAGYESLDGSYDATNGFARTEWYSVDIADGGTTDANASITYNGKTLKLGHDGVASSGGEVDYTMYYLNSGDLSTKTIHDKVAGADITLKGGTLTVETQSTVTATGGAIKLVENGVLNGSLTNTNLTLKSGIVNATISSGKVTGDAYALSEILQVSGNVSISGSFVADALTLTTIDAKRVDVVEGNSGNSGFLLSGGHSVQIINGGTLDIAAGTIVKHGSIDLTLGENGYATSAGTLGHEYLLVGNDAVNVGAILAKDSSATIKMQGGTLNVDAATNALTATAGIINLNTDVELGGTISGATINASKGTLAATLSGNNTLVGDGYVLNSKLNNSGTLTLSGSFSIGSGLTVQHTDAGYESLNGSYDATNGFARTEWYSVDIADGDTADANATITYDGKTLKLGNDGVATRGGEVDYTMYYLNSGDLSTKTLHDKVAGADITLKGGTLTVETQSTVTATGGAIKLVENGVLNGSLTNTELTLKAGTVNATITDGKVTGDAYALSEILQVSGNVSISGSFVTDALTLTTIDAKRVDVVEGNSGNSGFLKHGDSFVQIINGGTLTIDGAIVSHKDAAGALVLGTDGYARSTGGTNYGEYLLTGSDKVSTNMIHTGEGAGALVRQEGGQLRVNDATEVKSTSGEIILAGATLSGEVADTRVTAERGSIAATLSGITAVTITDEVIMSGNNTHSGVTTLADATLTITHANALGSGDVVTTGDSKLVVSGVTLVLGDSIANTGELTLKGSIDASGLTLNRTEEGRLALSGTKVSLAESGFARGVEYSVQLVEGGTTVNDGVSISHRDYLSRTQLVLGEDGVARAGGAVDYTHYFLTGGDSAAVSEIADVSKQHQETLAGVTMDSGSLEVDQSIAVNATGGSIHITDDAVLSGTVEDTAVSTAAGDYSSEISALLKGDTTLEVNGGAVTVSGDNSYSGGTVVNGGSLLAGHDKAFGTGDVAVNDATLDLNRFTIANKVLMNGNSTLGHADGAAHIVLGGGSKVNFRDGYALGSGKTMEVAAAGATYAGALTLGGGTLELDGKLTVQGEVTFESGTQTTLDISGWNGADDGKVLVDFGSSTSGYTEESLKLAGIAGDWELEFDAATGVLTVVEVKVEPLPEPEFSPSLNRNQQIVYDTIKDIMGEGNPGGLLGELGKEVTGTRDEEKLKQLLDELGGAEYASLLNGQQAAARGHMRRLRGEMGSGHLLAGSAIRAYIEAYNHRSEVDGDAHGCGYELNESGGQFALEFLGEDSVSGGFAVAAGRSKLQPDGGMTQKSDNTYMDAFVMHRDGAYTGKFSLGVGVHKYDLDRRVAGNAVNADASGTSVNFMHESAWAMSLSESHSVQVFGAVESSFNKLGAFREKGADTASLQVESQDAWVTTLSLGARYLYSFAALESAPAATLSLQGGLEFDFGDTESEVEMNFEGARDHSFRQSGAERDTFGYNLGASLHLPVSAKAAIYANGDAVLRGDSYEVNANVGLQMAF